MVENVDYYSVTAARKISAAYQNFYLTGAKHPDRVMEEHDFVYIIEGNWEIFQENDRYLLHPGDVILLHAQQHHFGLTPCSPGTRTMYIHVNNDSADGFASDCPTDCAESGVQLDTVIHCQNAPNVQLLFQKIILAFKTDCFQREQKISCLFQLLLIEMANAGETTVQSMLLEKAFALMENNPNKIFRTDELASQLYVSGRTFRNHFFAAYHKTFTRYQMEAKLAKARILLQEYPEMPLSEIAKNLGFYDEFHFSKTFKKYYFVSPSQYRISSVRKSLLLQN